MPKYVDGFVIPLPKKNVKAYVSMARRCAPIWLSHGALEFRETIGEDLTPGMGRAFPKQLKLKPGETVVFSWIVFKSRAHRDRVNAAVMKDPRMLPMMKNPMPFDSKRMLYGGFTAIVDR